MRKRKISELLKIYSEGLESLTPEECVRLHQYASDQEKLAKKVKSVMSDILLNELAEEFPRVVNNRKATVVEGSERGPSGITLQEIRENKLPITETVFKTAATLSLTELRKISPSTMAKLEADTWYQEQTTRTASYIKWSAAPKKVVR